MAERFSSYFYRNPVSLKKLEDKLREELANFKPVENDPAAIKAQLEKLRARIDANTAELRNVG